MKNRTVSRLLYAEQVDMGGMPIRQPLPTQAVEQIDPFLLLHHANIKAPAHVKPVYAGGAQWMNAGMGIIHSERPPDDIQAIGGRQEIIQLWINTPAQHKMDMP